MQRDQDNNNQPKTLCHSCGRYILTSNFLLHEGRCQRMSELRSSRVSQNSQKHSNSFSLSNKQKSQKKQEPSSKYAFSTPISKQFIGSFKKSNKFNNQQPQQKIPCHFCGYPQTLQQLDTHPKVCQHWETECQFCKVKYPKSLMNDHQQMCQKNPRIIEMNRRNQMRRNQMNRHGHQQQQEEDPFMPIFLQPRNRNMYRPSPLMDIFGDFFGPSQNRRQQNINVIQFSSNNGGPRIFFRSNSSNPMGFIQIIEMMARAANPNQNPGLNQQQLSNLPRVKYHRKNKDQPDLCTVCYCQFQQNQEIIELKCKHMFHQQCIFQWLKRVSTCPVCKAKLKEGNQNQQENNGGLFQRIPSNNNQRRQNRGGGFFW